MLEQHNSYLARNEFISDMEKIYLLLIEKDLNSKNSSVNKKLEEIFSMRESNTVNAYLRFLYRFLKYLSENKDTIDPTKNSDILRSFISEKLLYVIAMNGLRNHDFEKYRKLLEEFKFFEHLNIFEIMKSNKDLSKFSEYNKKVNELSSLNDFSKKDELHNLLSKNDQLRNYFLNSELENIYCSTNIFLKYKASAFDKNPHYNNDIKPVLKILIDNKKLPKELLDNKMNESKKAKIRKS